MDFFFLASFEHNDPKSIERYGAEFKMTVISDEQMMCKSLLQYCIGYYFLLEHAVNPCNSYYNTCVRERVKQIILQLFKF